MQPLKNKAKVLVLASGEGTTFEALVTWAKSEKAAYEVAALATNKPRIGALDRARRLQVPTFFFPYERLDPEGFFKKVLETAEDLSVEVIALAGFVLLVREPLLSAFSGRILNTHPALLPSFGGKGMYGDKVHQAVIEAGHKESGVTIHLVNEKYDDGAVLGAVRVPVHEGEDFQSLAQKVRLEEKKLYPEVLNQFVTSLGFGC